MTRKFPPATGGMENFAYDLQASLSRKATVRIIKWGGSQRYLPFILPFFLVRASWILLTQHVDVIHAQDGILAVLAYMLSQLFRKPYVVVIHGLDITYSNTFFQMVIPRFVRKANTVFCISQAAADEAVKRGVEPTIVRVIPLGVTDDLYATHEHARQQLENELHVKPDTAVLLTIGRLVKRKGVAWFIDQVMPKLVKLHKDLIYIVVGEGEHRGAVESAIKRHNLGNHVMLLGKVANDTISMLYNGADVFVQPNIVVSGDIEGFGRVLLEASLCELPVVAAGIEGITEAIANDKNGLLVPSENSDEFVKSIAGLLGNKASARKFGARSRAYTLAHYQWDSIAERYMQTYDSLVRVH